MDGFSDYLEKFAYVRLVEVIGGQVRGIVELFGVLQQDGYDGFLGADGMG